VFGWGHGAAALECKHLVWICMYVHGTRRVEWQLERQMRSSSRNHTGVSLLIETTAHPRYLAARLHNSRYTSAATAVHQCCPRRKHEKERAYTGASPIFSRDCQHGTVNTEARRGTGMIFDLYAAGTETDTTLSTHPPTHPARPFTRRHLSVTHLQDIRPETAANTHETQTTETKLGLPHRPVVARTAAHAREDEDADQPRDEAAVLLLDPVAALGRVGGGGDPDPGLLHHNHLLIENAHTHTYTHDMCAHWLDRRFTCCYPQ